MNAYDESANKPVDEYHSGQSFLLEQISLVSRVVIFIKFYSLR